MPDPRKIKWMTRASVFEKEYGKTDMSRNSFFISDYVRYHLLKNFIAVTVAAVLILMLYCLCNIEYIMTLAAEMNLTSFIRNVVLIYVVILAVYTVIGIVVYIRQYKASRKRLRKYYRMLKLIEKYSK